MSTTSSPNMNLPIPGVGTEPGPDYATDINSSLTIIDQHDHTSGSGVQLTPSSLNINSALTFNNNFATDLAGLTLIAQLSTPATQTAYVSGVDLYYVDGHGNNIQLTSNGGVAGSPGSISNLTSPASASYVSASSTFVWQSGVSIAANMDAGSILMRNLSPNSTFALTLQPPSALGANYSITLPPLPASTKALTITSSGVMGTSQIPGSQITSGTVTGTQIATGTITSSNLANLAVQTGDIDNAAVTAAKLASNAVTTIKIVDAAVTGAKIAAGTVDSSNLASGLAFGGTPTMNNGANAVLAVFGTTTGRGIIRGTVDSAGNVAEGEGFTSSRTATGQYGITFSAFFANTPVVVAGSNVAQAGAAASIISSGGFTMSTWTTSTGAAVNAAFSFIAIGN